MGHAGRMSTPTFTAIGLVCQDLSASLAFYRLLGLAIPAGADSEPHAEVTVGSTRLMWDPVSTVRSFTSYDPPSGSSRINIAFDCGTPAGVDEMYAAITAAGHEGKLAPFDAFWGQRYATVLDPDGNGVDLYAAAS